MQNGAASVAPFKILQCFLLRGFIYVVSLVDIGEFCIRLSIKPIDKFRTI